MRNDFQGRSVLLTGATSGIGFAIAKEFVARGASLLLTGRNHNVGEQLREELSNNSNRIVFLPADLNRDGEPEVLVNAMLEHFGKLDVLVNNAGVLHRGTALQCSDEQWSNTIATNLSSVFRLSRAALPTMIARGKGVIVNVASDWGLVGGKSAVAYCASKGAVVQLTRSMALDHAREGIRVLAVCPGDTDTAMLDSALPEASASERLAVLGSALPIGRIAQPVEIARVVCFAASDDASFMTGATIAVDGGNTAG